MVERVNSLTRQGRPRNVQQRQHLRGRIHEEILEGEEIIASDEGTEGKKKKPSFERWAFLRKWLLAAFRVPSFKNAASLIFKHGEKRLVHFHTAGYFKKKVEWIHARAASVHRSRPCGVIGLWHFHVWFPVN